SPREGYRRSGGVLCVKFSKLDMERGSRFTQVENNSFVRSAEPFLRPDLPSSRAPRAAAVKTGRRPPPEAARSGLDGGEQGPRLPGSGIRQHGAAPPFYARADRPC